MTDFSIEGIRLADKGYYINLGKSRKRNRYVKEQIKKYKITNLNRFRGLIYDGDYKPYGCTLSHLELFKNFLKSDLDTIFICEDDFEIREKTFHPVLGETFNFIDSLQRFKNDIDNIHWDVVMMGCSPRNATPVSENLSIVSKSTGAWAYIINKKAASYIVKHSNYFTDYLAIDDWLSHISNAGLISLMSNEILIHHANGKFKSEVQPDLGTTSYDDMIRGFYQLSLWGHYHKKSFCKNNVIAKALTINLSFNINDLSQLTEYICNILPKQFRRCKFILSYSSDKDISNYPKFLVWLREIANCKLQLNYKVVNTQTSDISKGDIITPFIFDMFTEYTYSSNIDVDLLNKICKDFDKDKLLDILDIQHSEAVPAPTIYNQIN